MKKQGMNSVCMATYNGEKFLEEQIHSILMQLRPEDELVISDDASTDRTVAIIQSIADPRIRLYCDQQFRDPIKNFQHALSHSRGDYIFLSDQDDVWMEGKYQLMLTQLQQYDLVISDSMIVNQQLEVIHPSFFKYFGSRKGILKNMIKSSYYGSCMAFSRAVLEASLPFPDTREIGHDLWIGLVAEMKYKVLFYEKPLLKYRRHEETFTSERVGKSSRTPFQMLRGRIIMAKEIIRYITNNKIWSN